MKEQIKKYFSIWDFARIVKLILGGGLLVAYFSTKESMYLVGSLFFSAQAVFNIGCPGGSCAAPTSKSSQKKIMNIESYQPSKENKNV
ncbi:MAG: hypothetical protein AUK44_01465 [Porphyromonadaceae bacterium CG2_30_38_12]|nr:MAG: hypothetical protein AUK44_01465 [Porphyromonadaceae bacterium CG2_30_38_12]